MLINNLPEFFIGLKTKVKASELYKLQTSQDSANVLKLCFEETQIEWVEHFVVLALNRANKVIGFYKLSTGGMNGTYADPKVVLQFALLSNASGIVLCHNHPSGNLQPSGADVLLTQKIKNAVSYFDIQLLDHIILTAEGYLSMGDEGLL